MAALDTNVVLRLIIGDDPKQARAAEKQVAAEACTVAASVLMECEWVLRAVYRLDPALISASFRDLLALPHIDALDPVLTQQTLRAYESGLDFADALHAAQRRDGERFVTFDRLLARRAPKSGALGVVLLQG
jgi:predicted nucleic acid-binding protein